jgi:hypothetical protein
MIAFEVMINDHKLVDAGIDGLGVLSASLWSARRKPSSDAEVNQEHPPEELILEVGGLKTARGEELEEHRSWLRKSLQIGDVIVIRIKELDTVDQPETIRTDNPDLVQKAKRRYFEELKKEFGE